MEKISNSIAKGIADELKLNQDQTEVLAYGAFAAIQVLLSIVLVLVFGTMFGVGLKPLIIVFTISILRKYSGGVHASSPSICNFIGTFVSVGQAVILSRLQIYATSGNVLIIGIIVFVLAYFLIYKLAPVDSVMKPIRTVAKKNRLRKASISVLSIYMVVVFTGIALSVIVATKALYVYILCIYSGILWQVFTLTWSGHIIVSKIDVFLNQILTFNRKESE